MTAREMKSVFISYRRRDTLPLAMYISDAIKRSLADANVFIDVESIEASDRWPARIREALEQSSALVVLIGPKWLEARDAYGRRRLDNPEDWVRREIEVALERGLKVIPVLFFKAALPTDPAALPETLAPLLSIEPAELHERTWSRDVAHLVKILKGVGFRLKSQDVKYPRPGKVNEHELTDEQMRQALGELPGWTVEETDDARGGYRREFVRTYTFGSFEDAIHFMATAARHVTRVDHHPDWRNLWSTVVVKLTTWDIGHKPSTYDVALAKYLERLYGDYTT